ncbi:hypothetical protein Salmuc_01570 [Salipiger mucosus DSM 16094]|uniref:Uncharacterized protein n=1 Tax=Salipiger mucosus DSM 16094 TaxID=1123237 RepID=S9SKL1_9RHOB|nr:hypothetical protein Salmuc_01570 [Salipiger mucosus DSM 16094]
MGTMKPGLQQIPDRGAKRGEAGCHVAAPFSDPDGDRPRTRK